MAVPELFEPPKGSEVGHDTAASGYPDVAEGVKRGVDARDLRASSDLADTVDGVCVAV
jgi:hypothetical protein